MSNFIFRIGETEDGKAVKMDLPTLIETRLFDLASSGGGKSYALRVLIEKTAGHVQWLIIDPEGEFASLREKFDFLLVGKEGEIPVDTRSAKLLARKVMETRASAIIDLYGADLTTARVGYVADFLNELMALPKNLWSPVMVAIDEAHKFAPESVKGRADEAPARARQAVITLSDSGRKQSRGCVIATQRLSKLAADARAELRNNLIGLTVQDIDRDRAAGILGIPNRQNEVLRELNAGEFYAFGPAFVSHKGVFKMKIDAAITRHPKPGEGRLIAVPEASKAIRALMAEMGDLPAQVVEEQNALTSAQHEVTRLRNDLAARERELKARPVESKPAAPQVKIEYVDRPILNGEVKDFIVTANALRATLDEFPARLAQSLQPTISPVVSNLALILGKVEQVQRAQVAAPKEFVRAQNPNPAPYQTVRPSQARVITPTDDAVNLRAGERKMLQTLAQRYPTKLTRAQLGTLAGFTPSGGTFGAYFSNLKRGGFISEASNGDVEITQNGFDYLGADVLPAPRTTEELLQMWRKALRAGERKMLDMLVQIHPENMTRTELGERTGFTATGGTFGAYLSTLRRNVLVEVEGEQVRASDTLFL